MKLLNTPRNRCFISLGTCWLCPCHIGGYLHSAGSRIDCAFSNADLPVCGEAYKNDQLSSDPQKHYVLLFRRYVGVPGGVENAQSTFNARCE